MLSHITCAKVAPARPRFGMGASLAAFGACATPRALVMEPATATAAVGAAVRHPRPWMPRTSLIRCASAQAAAQVKSALAQPTSQKFAYTTTRNAAIGGGAMGPHPARDPV